VNPTVLLAIATGLFVAPATYLLSVSTLSERGSLGAATLAGPAQAVLWVAGGAALLVPFAIPRFLRSADRAKQLLLILVHTVAASVAGLVLSFVTGDVAPVWVLSGAAMLAILGWSWAYRQCFEAAPIGHTASRYTTLLVALGAIALVFVALRTAFWSHFGTSGGGSASTGFMIFLDALVGTAALSTAWLRKHGSAHARAATRVLSWALLPIPLLGTLTSLYWIFAVRKQELLSSGAQAG